MVLPQVSAFKVPLTCQTSGFYRSTSFKTEFRSKNTLSVAVRVAVLRLPLLVIVFDVTVFKGQTPGTFLSYVDPLIVYLSH